MERYTPSRVRNNYKFELREPFCMELPFPCSDRVEQYAWILDNVLYIQHREDGHGGYAWDGCSPKRKILGLFWVGTPDGIIDYRTDHPITYYASLVHDVLCQYDMAPRKFVDRLFRSMLKQVGFPLYKLYFVGVRTFWVIGKIHEYVSRQRR